MTKSAIDQFTRCTALGIVMFTLQLKCDLKLGDIDFVTSHWNNVDIIARNLGYFYSEI